MVMHAFTVPPWTVRHMDPARHLGYVG